ncbi:MAG TPA: GNAT family N-acetyltransferase [Acidimicrobiia bacterium]|nr:GNAT family N-acetyltransferase [Acidimicrobiia bacterium]
MSARQATPEDVSSLATLYRLLEDEMTPLSRLWPLADGLAEPVEDAIHALVEDPDAVVMVGEIDAVAVGFLAARIEQMLPQAEGELIGSIRLVFVHQPAREVGVGEAMLDAALVEMRRRGVHTFDAHVLPGHRLVKNFFESGGFKARSIVMSRYEDA